MTFRVGMRVACVREGKLINAPGLQNVKVGSVYTVRGVVRYEVYGEGLYLEEIINPIQSTTVGDIERAYASYRFRPLIEKSTDTGMSVLRKLLNTKQKTKELCGNED